MQRFAHYSRPVAAAAVFLLSFCLAAPTALHAKSKGTTTLRVLVHDPNGKPVNRASVKVSRLKGKIGSPQKKVKAKGGSLQLRTSQQGTAPFPPIDQGRYMIQVISAGYQTYGDQIELTETEQSLTVTLSQPQEQFSVHKKP